MGRLKDKDSIDIYAVAGFCLGSPLKAAERFYELVGGDSDSPVVLQGLRNIGGGFFSPTRYGCVSAARFLGSDGVTRNDVYVRVNSFLDALELTF